MSIARHSICVCVCMCVSVCVGGGGGGGGGLCMFVCVCVHAGSINPFMTSNPKEYITLQAC